MSVASIMTLLLLALALAVQPWSVLAGVLLVTSENGLAKEVAYVTGWVLALAVVAIATIALYPQTPKVAAGSPWTSWVQIGAGVALGGWLLVRSRRPTTQSDAQPGQTQPPGSQPKWMARLDSMSPLPALVLGAFLPNYAIVVAAVGNVVQAGLTQAWAAGVLALFVLVASTGVAAPLLLLVFRREQAPEIYQSWRVWLIANGQKLVTLVLVVVAVVLISKGIVGLVT
jgi:hypothetical protein